jgi:predicted metal-binding protein
VKEQSSHGHRIVNDSRPIKQVRADWQDIVLVCRKCSKRLDGGFGRNGEETLAKSLRRSTGGRKKGRKGPIGVIEVDCLDICPKGAVVAMRAAAPDDWAVVPAGTPIARVIARLGLTAPDPAA